jgi:outer membrane lipoprotein carrier protein
MRADGRTGGRAVRTLALAGLLIALPAYRLTAQSQDADAILDRAVAAFQRVTTLRADFTQTVTDPMIGTNETSLGEYVAQRPNKFAMRWRHPAGDLILADGQTLWIYLPSTSPNQVIRSNFARGGQSVDVIGEFLDRPREHFTIAFVKSEAINRRPADVLAFTPRAANTPYRRVLVWIDRRDNLPRQVEISEAAGGIRRVTLDRLQVNGAVPASTFVFTPPAGARVVDASQD